MTRHYCTYFDRRYLTRGLAMYLSLRRRSSVPIELWVLALDDDTHNVVARLRLPGVRLIDRATFERANPALAAAASNRTTLEYYWSCTPALPAYVFAEAPSIDLITYLDADVLFFASPEPIFEEMGDASILLTPHRFAHHRDLEPIVGAYNVQMVAFRRDGNGIAALRWWGERCLDWCSVEPSDGKFGDQKYLDEFPARFSGVYVNRHKGVGAAPWNIGQHTVTDRDGQPYVDEEPLIFFHYHGFALMTDRVAVPNGHGYTIPRPVIRPIYEPYLAALDEATRVVRGVAPDFADGYTRMPLRRVLRNLEQRAFMRVPHARVAPADWIALLRRVTWPNPWEVREVPGLAARWLHRRGSEVLRRCGYLPQ